MSIRDPQTNAVMPIGEQGEICARGYHVMLGYNDNPDATAAAIDLSPQKTPSYWITVNDWPLTGSGKIQKFKLAEMYVSGKFEVLS